MNIHLKNIKNKPIAYEQKNRYRMYKSGRNWVVAGLATTFFLMLPTVTTQTVHADALSTDQATSIQASSAAPASGAISAASDAPASGAISAASDAPASGATSAASDAPASGATSAASDAPASGATSAASNAPASGATSAASDAPASAAPSSAASNAAASATVTKSTTKVDVTETVGQTPTIGDESKVTDVSGEAGSATDPNTGEALFKNSFGNQVGTAENSATTGLGQVGADNTVSAIDQANAETDRSNANGHTPTYGNIGVTDTSNDNLDEDIVNNGTPVASAAANIYNNQGAISSDGTNPQKRATIVYVNGKNGSVSVSALGSNENGASLGLPSNIADNVSVGSWQVQTTSATGMIIKNVDTSETFQIANAELAAKYKVGDTIDGMAVVDSNLNGPGIQTLTKPVTQGIDTINSTIAGALKDTLPLISKALDFIAPMVSSLSPDAAAAIQAYQDGIPDAQKSLQTMIDNGKKLMAQGVTVTTLADTTKNGSTITVLNSEGVASSIGNMVETYVSGWADGIEQMFYTVFGLQKDPATGLTAIETISKAAGPLGGMVVNAAETAVKAVASGIEDGVDKVVQTASNITADGEQLILDGGFGVSQTVAVPLKWTDPDLSSNTPGAFTGETIKTKTRLYNAITNSDTTIAYQNVDKSQLKKAIDTATAKNSDDPALATAKTAWDNPDASQKDVDQALLALEPEAVITAVTTEQGEEVGTITLQPVTSKEAKPAADLLSANLTSLVQTDVPGLQVDFTADDFELGTKTTKDGNDATPYKLSAAGIDKITKAVSALDKTYTVNGLADLASTITAPATDTDTATDKPAIDGANITKTDTGYDVTGKTKPKTPVTVTDENGKEVGTGTSDGDGNFTVPVDKDKVTPGEMLTITPKDGTPVDVKVPTDDTDTATDKPEIKGAIATPTDTGYDVTGKTTIPNTPVTVTDPDGNELGNVTSKDDGSFTVPVDKDKVTPGEMLTITPKDGTPVDVKVPTDDTDTATDKPEIKGAIATPTDTGYDVTGKTTIPNTPVTVTDPDGNELGNVTSKDDGSFTVPVDKDKVTPGEMLTITPKDGTPVDVQVPTDDTDTATDKPAIEGAGIAKTDTGYDVTGKTKPNTPVTVTDENGKEVGTDTSDNNGDFKVEVPSGAVQPGDKLTITPKDGTPANVTVPDKTPEITDTTVTPTDDGYDVTGKTTTPNTPITITDKTGDPIATGVSKDDGTFTIPVNKGDVKPGDPITVTPTGGKGTTVTVPEDKPAIADPGIAKTDTGYDVTGKTKPNTPVTVTDKTGKTVGTGTSNGDGNFTVPVDKDAVTPGDKLTITPKDGTPANVTVPDKTPEITDTTVTPTDDGYDVTGKTTTPNTPITITDKTGDPIATGVSKDDGTFTIPVNKGDVKPGDPITVTPTGGKGTTVTVPEDKPAIADPGIAKTDTGYDVTGKTKPNTPVTVTDKTGKTVGTGTSNGDGNFTVPVDKDAVTPGDKLTITPKDGTPANVTVPDKTPEITDTTVTPTDDGYDVTGKTTTPNTPITITDKTGDPIATGVSKDDGTFTIPVNKGDVKPGDPITVTPTGGKGTTVTVPEDKPAIADPGIAKTDTGYDVTGKTKPNTPVTVTDKTGKTVGTGTSNGDGNFTVPVDKDAVTPGDKLTITPKDGTPANVTVPDKTPEITDTTVTPTDDGYDVTGKTTTPNTPITITDKTGDPIATGVSKDDGTFTIPVNKGDVKPGDPITVTPTGGKGTTVTVPEDKPAIADPGIAKTDTGYDVTGKTKPNTPVTVTDKTGKTVGTGTSNGDGNFTVPVDKDAVTPGDKLTITPKDGTPANVTVPDKTPEITDTTVTPTDDGYDVTGKTTTPNTPITITDKTGDPIATGVSKDDGTFTIPVNKGDVKPGDPITVTPTGGKGTTVTVPEDKPAIADPGIAKTDTGYDVTGKTKPNTPVTVTDKTGKTVGTGTSNGDGNFTVPVDKDAVTPGDKLTITPKDGTPANVTVPDKTPEITDTTVTPTDDGYDVTGKTTTPNTPITITDKTGDPIATGVSKDDGTFTIPVNKGDVKPGDPITVTPTGGKGTTVTVPEDKPAIADPGIAKTDTGYDVTGKTKPNTPVTVTDKTGKTVGTGTSNGDGNFTVPVDKDAVTPGDKLTITPKDGTPANVTVPDKTPEITDTTVTPTDDGYDVTGKTTTPNTPITITDKTGDPIATGVSKDDGTFTIPVNKGDVKPGDPITVTPTGGKGTTVTVPEDKPAIADPGIAKTDTGYDVTGKTTPNTPVTVTDENGKEVGTDTSDNNGDFKVAVPSGAVQPGDKLTITPKDGTPANVTVPDKTPEITDTTVTPTDNGGYDVTGKTVPNTPVTITDKNGNPIATGSSDDEGNFTIPVDKGEVKPGDPITITPNGGKGTTVTVPTGTTDNTPEVTNPKVTPTDNGGYDVTGKTVPNTPVTITDKNGNPIATGSSDDEGNFTIPVDKGEVKPGDPITITPNGGEGTTVTVPTGTTDNTPEVTDTTVTPTDDGYDVTGNTTPNTPITIKDKTGDPIATGVSKDDGTFTIPVDKGDVKPGDPITVTPAGGKGTTVTVPTGTTDNTPEVTDTTVTPTDNGGYDVTGKTVPNTPVTITDKNGNPIATGSSDDEGNFTIPVDKGEVKPGDPITITPNGGKGTTVTVPTGTTDNTPEVTDTTVTPTDNGGYDVTGKTVPNTPVTITDKNGNPIATGSSDDEGNFTIPVDKGEVKPGDPITITPNGGKGTTVTVPTGTTDNTPEVTDTTVTPTDNGGYDVTGKTVPNTPVTITDKNGNPIATGSSDNEGNFTISVDKGAITPGEAITITPAGGKGTTITVPTNQTSTIKNPTITATDKGYNVTGKTTPNTSVTITNASGKTVGTGTSDGNGDFAISVAKGSVTPGETLTLTTGNGDTATMTVPAATGAGAGVTTDGTGSATTGTANQAGTNATVQPLATTPTAASASEVAAAAAQQQNTAGAQAGQKSNAAALPKTGAADNTELGILGSLLTMLGLGGLLVGSRRKRRM